MQDELTEDLRRWLNESCSALTGAIRHTDALAAEASNRRFWRLHTDNGPFIVMASPPELEQNDMFERLAGVFLAAGVNVPEVLLANRADGYFLQTDLGDTRLGEAYDGGADAALRLALSALLHLSDVSDPAIPPYTMERFGDELALFDDWFVSRWLGETVPAGLSEARAAMLQAIAEQPTVCVHRDYHSRNLLLSADGDLGIVDFQDALMGPVSYDLASLLRDCYHRFAENEIDHWRDAYLASFCAHRDVEIDPITFERWLDLTAAQRQLKALGIFVRLELRDGKRSHLGDVLPVVDHLRYLARKHRELAPVGELLYRLTPAIRRRLQST